MDAPLPADAYIQASEIQSAHVNFYRDYGFLVARDVLSTDEIEEIKAETLSLFRGERGLIDGLQPAAPQDTELDTLRKYLCIHFPHKPCHAASQDSYSRLERQRGTIHRHA